jgi:PAS domain S-box-containing protein
VAQQPVEMILMRQLASYLAMPVWLVDTKGTVVYFNLAAEQILGQRFDETGEIPWEVWRRAAAVDRDGNPMETDTDPLSWVMHNRRPVQSSTWIRAFDGKARHIQVTGFPLVDQAGIDLGYVALFWEDEEQ